MYHFRVFTGFVQQSSAPFDPRNMSSTNQEIIDENNLKIQIQQKLDQDKHEQRGDDVFGPSTNITNMVHDQYSSYQSHENSHTNSYTGTLNSAHSQQHSPHASSVCSGGTASGSNAATATAGYVTPTPINQQHPQSDYESSYHSSSMNSSQHSSGQAQNPFPPGNQIIVQDPMKPDLLK